MGQLGFFDLIRRYESLDEKSDPLVAIAAMVPFESFRSKLKAALIKGELRTSDATRKSLAGRKPWDEVSRDCMSNECAPTIEPRIRISRFDDANKRCKVSNQPIRLSALFLSTQRFTTRSTHPSTQWAQGRA